MSGLLDGVRVLELSQLIAAPLCGLQLLDLGADVVKVEPPGGEEGRRLPPLTAEGESLWFHALNRGKRGVVVERGDAATLRRLVAWADVVVENLAGAAALSYDDVAAAQPALVWCAITGRGAGRGGRAVDPSLQATMGLAALTGEPDGPPLRVPVPVIDFTTAAGATPALLAALWRGGAGAPGRPGARRAPGARPRTPGRGARLRADRALGRGERRCGRPGRGRPRRRGGVARRRPARPRAARHARRRRPGPPPAADTLARPPARGGSRLPGRPATGRAHRVGARRVTVGALCTWKPRSPSAGRARRCSTTSPAPSACPSTSATSPGSSRTLQASPPGAPPTATRW